MYTQGRTVLITGATDGIGKQTAKEIASQGARVLVHGRNPQKVDRTMWEIRQNQPDAQLAGYVADFSSLKAVAQMADQILTSEGSLQVLINNAGIYMPDFQLSEDGYELTFAVNHLAPFLLTMKLINMISINPSARIINVTSVAHRVCDLDIEKINAEDSFKGWGAYKISKFANILFTYQLARRLDGSGVTVNCLHPGAVDTKVLRSAFPSMQGISLEDGARSSVYLASSEEVEGVTGKYFENRIAVASSAETYDAELQNALWEKSKEWVGIK